MKSLFTYFIFFALIGALVFLVLNTSSHTPEANWFSMQIQAARIFYADNRILTVLLFALSHIVSATVGVPGGCSFLNILSGAVFGFWQGCSIVYPVTMISAAIGYFSGARLRGTGFLKRYSEIVQSLKSRIADEDFLYLITLRLSPLLPFGILNVALGFAGVRPGVYFTTTFVGIFFDVVLLNNVGAAAYRGSEPFVISFVALFLIFLGLQLTTRRIRAVCGEQQ